jgi:transcriptional regulator with XRE-family HTH domain
MPADSAALLVHCQLALGLTQQELGDLLGRDRRTIQRWQESGFEPMADQAETLAHALQSVRPDLAEQVRELAKSAIVAGATSSDRPATAEVIDAILRAGADAAGTSPESIRPAITAALLKAEEAGVEVSAIVAALTPPHER